MTAKSIMGKSPEEIKTGLQEYMTDGLKPTLAIVFLSQKQYVDEIRTIVQDKDIQIFGAFAIPQRSVDRPVGSANEGGSSLCRALGSRE